jgi:hypothetical protein
MSLGLENLIEDAGKEILSGTTVEVATHKASNGKQYEIAVLTAGSQTMGYSGSRAFNIAYREVGSNSVPSMIFAGAQTVEAAVKRAKASIEEQVSSEKRRNKGYTSKGLKRPQQTAEALNTPAE